MKYKIIKISIKFYAYYFKIDFDKIFLGEKFFDNKKFEFYEQYFSTISYNKLDIWSWFQKNKALEWVPVKKFFH